MDDTATTLRSDNLICLPGAGRSEALLGVSLLYKAESAQTGGRLVCAEITVPPRQGVPPHRHTAEDEAFYVLAGRVAMGGDEGAPVVLEAGSFFYGPRGQVHGFACDGAEPARLLVFVAPGSGIERMFGELAELTRVRGSSLDFAEVGEACGRYGVAFVR